jgi:hypothetical protein
VSRIAKEVFTGTIRGTVTSKGVYIGHGDMGGFLSFYIKLDEKIENIPEAAEIPVWSSAKGSSGKDLFCLRLKEGDKVLVNGKIINYRLVFWQIEVIRMEADHIYNETSDYGF